MSTTAEGNPDLARQIQGEINKASGWYMALGVVLLLGGVAGLLYPTYAGLGLTVLVGWLLIIGGAMYLFNSLLVRVVRGGVTREAARGAALRGPATSCGTPVSPRRELRHAAEPGGHHRDRRRTTGDAICARVPWRATGR